jgi:DNA modification methylase
VSVELLHGDCVELMRGMPDCSVDSVVTDPPYELGFMGKAWDGAGIAYSLVMWVEALRVLKPGGHLLAFGGTRTYHRMACAIEDAGFEIRDSIHWVYGSGFPKSLNIGKAIDKRGGSIPWQREFAEHLRAVKPKDVTAAQINAHVATNGSKSNFWGHFIDVTSQPLLPTVEQYRRLRELLPIDPVWDEQFLPEAEREVVGYHDAPAKSIYTQAEVTLPTDVPLTAPATAEAARWEGWGTALKPAHEPVVVARKPLSGTVAGNVLVWGTGGLNIDGCRVGAGDDRAQGGTSKKGSIWGNDGKPSDRPTGGRWPANIVLDGAAAAALNQQSGVSVSKQNVAADGRLRSSVFGNGKDKGGVHSPQNSHSDSGGASRFFTQADFGPDDWPFVYQAKPSKRERNAGLDGMEAKPTGDAGSPISNRKCRKCGLVRFAQPHCTCAEPEWEEASRTANANYHPTVKPVALMRHLVRLVTPPGGTVLDPFAGSGTTLVAAVLEGMNAIGCEMTDEYLPIIEGRVAWAEEQVFVREELEKAQPEQPRLL